MALIPPARPRQDRLSGVARRRDGRRRRRRLNRPRSGGLRRSRVLVQTQRGDRILNRLGLRRLAVFNGRGGAVRLAGGVVGCEREHRVGRGASRGPDIQRPVRRRLVEVDDDRVAIAAHAVRDRLRELDTNARAGRTERVVWFDRHRRNRTLRVCGSRVGNAPGGDVAEVEDDRQGIGTRGDVGDRLGRLDDERRPLRVHPRADGLEPRAGRRSRAGRCADARIRCRHGG